MEQTKKKNRFALLADLKVEVDLAPHGAEPLGTGGRDPLVDGHGVGVEVPFQHHPFPLILHTPSNSHLHFCCGHVT